MPLDILTIYSPAITLNLINTFPIYQTELQLNKANNSDKETSFLDLNIKCVGSDVHANIYDKRDDLRFPINIPPDWMVVCLDSSRTVFILRSWLDSRCCTSVWDLHSKNLQITSKFLTGLKKPFGKFFMSYSELLSKCGEVSFQEYVSEEISHPGFCGDLVCKLRWIKGATTLNSSLPTRK